MSFLSNIFVICCWRWYVSVIIFTGDQSPRQFLPISMKVLKSANRPWCLQHFLCIGSYDSRKRPCAISFCIKMGKYYSLMYIDIWCGGGIEFLDFSFFLLLPSYLIPNLLPMKKQETGCVPVPTPQTPCS